jgi:type IV pilus assembly protein PilM
LQTGIDISAKRVYAVEIDRYGAAPRVRSAASTPLPAGSVVSGEIMDQQAVASRLRHLLREAGMRASRVRLAIGGPAVSLKWIKVPRMSDEDLEASVEHEAGRHLPKSDEQLVVRFIPTQPAWLDSQSEMQVLLAAARERAVASRAECAELAGCRPVAMELEHAACVRSLASAHTTGGIFWRKRALGIILVRAEACDMLVAREGELEFARSVQLGTDAIAQAVAASLRISSSEAEALLASDGARLGEDGSLVFASESQTPKVDVSEALDELPSQARRLIHFYMSLFPDRSFLGMLDTILLCGEWSNTEGLSSYLSQRLGVTVGVGDPFAGLQLADSFDVAELEDPKAAYSVAVGLALPDELPGIAAHDLTA